ncbi:GNAT family N-acetyltransferase [Shewanella maritima]|uniref:GNAT family N-acetyltransferase n=1 Tax=Shewanella maritima TaxID=2520507 RepID=UPI00373520B0
MQTRIETDSLIIQLMRLDEADLLFELDQDPEVMKYINGGKPSSRHDIEQRMLPRISRFLNPDKGWGFWKVTAKASDDLPANLHNQFLGWVLIRPMGFFTEHANYQDIEVGWRFKQIAWGKGVATQSAKHLMQHITKNQTDIEKFSAIAVPDNMGSIAVMKRLGMDFIEQTHDPETQTLTVVLYSVEVSEI